MAKSITGTLKNGRHYTAMAGGGVAEIKRRQTVKTDQESGERYIDAGDGGRIYLDEPTANDMAAETRGPNGEPKGRDMSKLSARFDQRRDLRLGWLQSLSAKQFVDDPNSAEYRKAKKAYLEASASANP